MDVAVTLLGVVLLGEGGRHGGSPAEGSRCDVVGAPVVDELLVGGGVVLVGEGSRVLGEVRVRGEQQPRLELDAVHADLADGIGNDMQPVLHGLVGLAGLDAGREPRTDAGVRPGAEGLLLGAIGDGAVDVVPEKLGGLLGHLAWLGRGSCSRSGYRRGP